jgi:acyl-CoA reductase-like NAD-dependent aldehyde dehydrogenase
MTAAFIEAGIPREAISIYPGGADVGAAVLDACARSVVFGGTPTVDRYRGNPRVQAHGPGFSKILLGDDQVDRWEDYLDLMVESVFINSGRSCINCSGIWAVATHARIALRSAQRVAAVRPLPPDIEAALAAFCSSGSGGGDFTVDVDADLQAPGVADVTATYREGVTHQGREVDYLLPTVIHVGSRAGGREEECMFPFVTVVSAPSRR